MKALHLRPLRQPVKAIINGVAVSGYIWGRTIEPNPSYDIVEMNLHHRIEKTHKRISGEYISTDYGRLAA